MKTALALAILVSSLAFGTLASAETYKCLSAQTEAVIEISLDQVKIKDSSCGTLNAYLIDRKLQNELVVSSFMAETNGGLWTEMSYASLSKPALVSVTLNVPNFPRAYRNCSSF